jgi:hypothetical protein
VPWQDVAEPSSRWSNGDDGVLELARSDLLDWELILGSPGSPGEPAEPPLDALMQESVLPRLDAAAHPYIGVGPQPPEAPPGANPINGHEWLPINSEDLQFACVFPLEPLLGGEVRDCNVIDEKACACLDSTHDLAVVNARMKPVCQQSDGSYTSVQTATGAQPSIRHGFDMSQGLRAGRA